MPKIRVNDVDLFYEETGSGPETMLFSHGYLMDHTMFQGQIDAFKDRFRIIAFDHRGHGQSEVTAVGYELDNLVTDAIALIEALDCAPCHFVGMSTGGFVGMRIGLRRPDLLQSLVLMDTSAEAEGEKKLREYNLLLTAVRFLGWWAVIGQVMPILFHEKFLNDPQRQAEVKKWRSIITGHDKKGMIAFGKGIFSRDSVLDQLDQIACPTDVIIGEYDQATTRSRSQNMVDNLSGAQLHVIPDAGHSAAVEEPETVTTAMRAFYERVGILA